MSNQSKRLLALAVCGCSALWSVQAMAQAGTNGVNYTTSGARINQLQQEINNLQQQVQTMKQNQAQQQQQASESAAQKKKGPKKTLSVGGAVVTEYQVHDKDQTGKRTGGNLVLDYFDLNFSGQYGNITYGADERWSTVNFADDQYLHYGWAAYSFGADDNQRVKGGFYRVPFGNLPYGYQSFWGNVNYYTGFTDNQAAGFGYKYEANGVRFDLDAFKNDDLGQNTTYGSNPFEGYDQINGGVGRLGYTFNQGGDNNLTISASGRGGQLEVGENGNGQNEDNGTRWAGSLAANANIGNWVLQAQAVDYKYNIPDDTQYGGADVPTDTVTFENYGFGYNVPAKGQIYTASIGRSFDVDIGPISKFEVYDDYGYLHSGEGKYSDLGDRIGDTQENVFGVNMVAGPIYFWAEAITGKNAALAFDGPNDGDWHTRFNLTAAYYFSGDILSGS